MNSYSGVSAIKHRLQKQYVVYTLVNKALTGVVWLQNVFVSHPKIGFGSNSTTNRSVIKTRKQAGRPTGRPELRFY